MKERIITAICILAVALPLIYFGGIWFTLLGLGATAVAAFEMVNMHNTVVPTPKWIGFLIVLSTLGIVFVPGIWLSLAIFTSCVALLFIFYAFKIADSRTLGFYMITLMYIGFTFRALLMLRQHGLILFFFSIITVILTDSMAYFSGRLFGRRKLAPTISPKKTVEGAIGGWLTGCVFALLFGHFLNLFTDTWILVSISVILPILSQIGDLIASAFKRKYKIKDYGNLFPGHGGVMDRVDSQLLAALLIYIVIEFGGVL